MKRVLCIRLGDCPNFRGHHAQHGRENGTVPLPDANVLAGRLSDIVDLGPLVKATVVCGEGTEFQVSLGKREWADLRFAPGSQVSMLIAAEDVHVMFE